MLDKLHDGTLVSMGRFCGNEMPPPRNSTSNGMVVKFRANQVNQGNGFLANYEASMYGSSLFAIIIYTYVIEGIVL